MLADALTVIYPWIKALHVISVIAWMAGLFYLPRLFVYHAERAQPGDALDAVFQTMEGKLLAVIMKPAMMASWLFGLCLALTPGVIDWAAGWPYAKLFAVLAMTWFHIWLGARRRDFARGANRLEGRRFRMMNEVPTVLLVIIVVSVIARPF